MGVGVGVERKGKEGKKKGSTKNRKPQVPRKIPSVGRRGRHRDDPSIDNVPLSVVI